MTSDRISEVDVWLFGLSKVNQWDHLRHGAHRSTDWIPADLHGSGLDPTVPSLASAQGARADLPDDIDIIGVESFFTNRPDSKRHVFFFFLKLRAHQKHGVFHIDWENDREDYWENIGTFWIHRCVVISNGRSVEASRCISNICRCWCLRGAAPHRNGAWCRCRCSCFECLVGTCL